MTVSLTPPSRFARLVCAPLLAGLFASPAGALTLGEIRVFSHLGETLHASVPVRLESGEVLEAKCLKLVPDQDGLGAAVAMTARVELRDKVGEIVIGSRQNIPEPILRFNLQVQCGYGFHSREFTLLLDPPEARPLAATVSSGVTPQLAETSAPLPPVARPRRERPSRPALAAAPTPLAPKPVDHSPKLRLSTGDEARTQAGRTRAVGGAFQLRLSADLDLSRLGKKLSANENRDLKHKLQAIESDDDMAEILRLRNQIQSLETQMLALRQKTIEVMGLDASHIAAANAPTPSATPSPALSPEPVKPEPGPVAAETDAVAAPDVLPVAATQPLAQAQAAAALERPVGNSQLGGWTDYLIWVLVAAVSLGFAYMMWLYRGQHAEAHGLPDIFDDKSNDNAARNIPISRKLVSRNSNSEPNSPDNAEIVVPEKDRWAIEEAQILIAQGWREQAVNLLVEQIESNPYQLDIWLMLFEIHQKSANREAFAILAERFRSIAKGLPVWNTIRQMGAAMDPENPLYAL